MTKLRQLWLLTALGSVLVLAAGYFLLVSPKASKAESIRAEAVSVEEANVRLKSQIEMLNRQKKDLPRRQAELETFGARIPDNPALPTLIRSLSNAADGSGLVLKAISPSAPQRMTTMPAVGSAAAAVTPAVSPLSLAQIPVTVKVSGRYSQVSQFFSEVEGLPRAFLISTVDIAEDEEANAESVVKDKLLATITGTLFMTTKAPPVAVPVATAPVAE